MNLPNRILHNIANSTFLTGVATIGGVLSFGLLLRDWLSTQDQNINVLIVFIIGTIIFLSFGFYSLKIRDDNKNLQDIAWNFKAINTIYRDALTECFAGNSPMSDKSLLMPIEKQTIIAICQRIAQIYSKIISKDCMVTVKVLTREENRLYATTYGRSLSNCDRDTTEPTKFAVNEGMNTAFDKGLMKDSSGGIPHFYSADLTKHKNYRNERQDYLDCYKSALLVPIRKVATRNHQGEDIGFLSVDTKSRNRLNNEHHLVMLAALSDQMYNFFSLMRGKYKVNIGVDINGKT